MPPITFSDSDFQGTSPNQDDPMVITVEVENFVVKKVLIDQGSSVDILYWKTFNKMQIPLADLTPHNEPIYGFSGERVPTIPIRYLVVDAHTYYNILLGRPSINALGAIVSTPHLAMKFPSPEGDIITVHGDQRAARECYMASLKLPHPPLTTHNIEQSQAHTTLAGDDLDPRINSEARLEPVGETRQLPLEQQGHFLQVRTSLPGGEERHIEQVLKQNADLFAWSAADLPGVHPKIVAHRLFVFPNAKPVSQKKRKLGESRRQAAIAEADKLKQASFVGEAQYTTWLANVVLVKKPKGKWRMCVDYTDLNKACPRDAYPLPNIDRIVDGAAGHAILSFLDAYSGYNQIPMAEEDKIKTAFITEEANLYYRVMPFGLKNAGATYQRLMDRVFQPLLGRSVEVYVDDIIVKSPNAQQHSADLTQVFKALRTYNIRLNPEKCTFGVDGRKFLGFMLTQQGIEPNPEKCQTIIDMRSPANIKEVHLLVGRLTAISRFLPKLADKTKPMIQLLKMSTKFTWEDTCEQNFNTLKQLLTTPPVLTKPDLSLPLIVYIAASTNAVSSALVQERDNTQQPIYFTSRILQDPETRYQMVEKVALAIITAARRLRPYFQIYYALRAAWTHPSTVPSRLCQRPSRARPHDTWWTMHVDGSSNPLGAGSRIVLEGPDNVLIEQSLRFTFKTSNNQVEYEAIIVGLNLGRDVGAHKLLCKTDSKLTVGHLNGDYQIKDPTLTQYYHMVVPLTEHFDTFQIQHVPRSDNTRADILSKLASTKKKGRYKSLLQHTLATPSIEQQNQCLNITTTNTWMEPFIKYLEAGVTPPNEERGWIRKAA
ncbi:uncharacterized protein LOC114170230 [Vigna unguiculata]|uniref:uncharacterized protein LOC114170230 n=1 Tax=Vigna unguiculata TaxID=3917 RepID=UPI0010169DA1|nr:uncharacterized protein LOC114170230 [Vigna unguiculata]